MRSSLLRGMARSLLFISHMKLASLLLLAPLTIGCADSTSSEYALLTAAPGECGSIEAHVIGVFQADRPQTDSTIFLERPGKHVLVLSAHDAMTWHVHVSNGAVLVHVYAVGFGKQKVEVEGAKVDVITDSMADTGIGACGFSRGGASDGCDADSLMILASKRVHHDITSFHGCYKASTWRIGEDLSTTSDCAATTQEDWAGGCKAGGGDDSTCGTLATRFRSRDRLVASRPFADG